jgi:hypothetical protein
LQIFRKAIELGGRTAVSEESVADEVGQAQTNKEVEERRIKEAYNILEVIHTNR